MFGYTAFVAFGSPNVLENLIRLVVAYFKHSIWGSNAAHKKWCGAFGLQTLVAEQTQYHL